jgi:hypothetical protein
MAQDLAAALDLQTAGPMIDEALRLYDLGLAVIPAPAEDGKSVAGTVAHFQKWQRRLPRWKTEELFREHPGASIAILPHLCRPRLVVVDCDGDEDLEEGERRYGRSPVLVRTPRDSGWHLYYRAPKGRRVRQRNLRSQGLVIDIKAGPGAVVIVPPSVRPSSGKPYAFVRGGWEDLASLPVFPLTTKESRAGMADGKVREGSRNNHLFKELLQHAGRYGCDGLGAMEGVAHLINERDCQSLLPWDEVIRTAASAWKTHSSGNNWVGQGRRVVVPEPVLTALGDSPEALVLWAHLRLWHEGLRTRFAISPKAMAEAGCILGWSAKRYRKARDVLVERGFLRREHEGGRGMHDPHLFAFADPPGNKGAESSPNTNRTPSPLPAASPASAAQLRRKAA